MTLRSRRFAGWFLIPITVMLLSGCAHNPPEEPPAGSYLEDIFTTANTNPDVDMFRRAMPGYLRYLEGLALPSADEQTILRASGAYFGDAFCFVEDTDKEEASALYLKGRDLAVSELRRYRLFVQGIDRSVPEFIQSLSEGFDQRNLPALYWAAMNWAGWINLNLDKPEARADILKVEAMMEFINTLDESYKGATVHALLGALRSRPVADGGDPAKAKQHFDKAFILSGNSLLAVHVLYARFYAHQIQDRELFQQTLKQVLDTPANSYPDKTFVNEVARRKAKLLLENIDTYFKPAEGKKSPQA